MLKSECELNNFHKGPIECRPGAEPIICMHGVNRGIRRTDEGHMPSHTFHTRCSCPFVLSFRITRAERLQLFVSHNLWLWMRLLDLESDFHCNILPLAAYLSALVILHLFVSLVPCGLLPWLVTNKDYMYVLSQQMPHSTILLSLR